MHNHKKAFIIGIAFLLTIILGMFMFVYLYKHDIKKVTYGNVTTSLLV